MWKEIAVDTASQGFKDKLKKLRTWEFKYFATFLSQFLDALIKKDVIEWNCNMNSIGVKKSLSWVSTSYMR